jgi:hypothetical protein
MVTDASFSPAGAAPRLNGTDGDQPERGSLSDRLPKPVRCGGASNWTGLKQFTYVRYDLDVTPEGWLSLGLADLRPENVQVMDSVDFVTEIQRVGQALGGKVPFKHLARFV